MLKIDAHNHFIPKELLDRIRRDGAGINMEIIDVDGQEFIRHFEGFQYPLDKDFYDYDAKKSDLLRRGLDKAVLSPPPSFFLYWVDKEECRDVAQCYNDYTKAFCDRHSDTFIAAMATIPMQDISLAMRELERANKELGMTMVEIAPVILGKNLDEKEFFPVYEYCEANDVLVFLHPYFVGVKEQFKNYYNTNLVGNVLETNMGINSLIFGGVFEQFPKLKVLTSHGGGYFPYQLGRLEHGYNVRPEPKANISKSPMSYIGNLYFDTITHWAPALQFLVDNFGADHVCIGTDAPYDMSDAEPMDKVDALRISDEQKAAICHGVIEGLMGAR